MRRFVFSLQRLLSLRERKEKDWETKLGEVVSRCNKLKRDIRECERLHRETLGVRSADGGLGQLAASEFYMRRMREDVIKFQAELEKTEIEKDKVQVKYLEASRDRKVLEKLKEKQETEYYKEQLKEEMKMIDDINTSTAVRKKGAFSPAGNMEV
ncbi:MAG: flagellar export protein FliJ [Spirochaetales bacterium]|nr:flagellar export protein FliJ [Spirochaetales bacterium]